MCFRHRIALKQTAPHYYQLTHADIHRMYGGVIVTVTKLGQTLKDVHFENCYCAQNYIVKIVKVVCFT